LVETIGRVASLFTVEDSHCERPFADLCYSNGAKQILWLGERVIEVPRAENSLVGVVIAEQS
jgi:hypothetical protein